METKVKDKFLCVCVCVCVRVGKREREKEEKRREKKKRPQPSELEQVDGKKGPMFEVLSLHEHIILYKSVKTSAAILSQRSAALEMK